MSETTGTYGHIAGICLRADFTNQRCSGILSELIDCVLLESAIENVFALIKRLI